MTPRWQLAGRYRRRGCSIARIAQLLRTSVARVRPLLARFDAERGPSAWRDRFLSGGRS